MFKSFLLATLIISCTLPCLGKKKEQRPGAAYGNFPASERWSTASSEAADEDGPILISLVSDGGTADGGHWDA